MNDQFVTVVALSAPFNRQSLMVRYVYISPIHNIGKKACDSTESTHRLIYIFAVTMIICTLYLQHYFGVSLSMTVCF